MAGRGIVDDSVVERRLRPIYEWLDMGHTRKAIQECDKVLKKQPGLHCAQVLRGLALLRSGKNEEASNSISQVVAATPTDDSTLQALTIYFREIHQLEKICEIFEEATKKQSKSEDLLSHLFMAYVRVGNYKKQQQTAMALYKLKPKNPYYFWAVISIVMQAREQPPASSNRAVCLTLAERMVERFFREGKLEAEAEVLAYLYILELQNKFEEALDILETDLRDKITQQPANFVQLKRLHYHTSLKRWDRAHAIAKELIEQERDNWQHYESFCSSLLKLHEQSNPTTATEDGTESVNIGVLSEGVSWLRGVLATSEEQHGTKYRAPYLALLQLAWQLDKAGYSHLLDKLQVRVEKEMLGYLTRFGSKWCAFSDVRRFFVLVREENAAVLLQQLRALVTLRPDGVPTDVYMLHRHLTWLQVSRCLQPCPESTAEQHLATADQLLLLYNNTQHLASQTTLTDIRRNDIYLLLSGHSVLHALTVINKPSDVSDSADGPVITNGAPQTPQGRRSQDCNGVQSSDGAASPAISLSASQLLVKLAGLLEAAVASSKANFQLKLLLLQVYNMIGACGSGRSCYESLEVKSVQLDTLGHVAALQALDAAHYSTAAAIFQATNSFFVAAAKDTCEPMIQAYKYGSLTRIPEFGEFRERLERSVHFATVTAEQMLLELTHTVSCHKAALSQLEQQAIDPEMDRTDYDTLVDNSDHSVKIAWHCVYSNLASSQLTTKFAVAPTPPDVSSSSSGGPTVPCPGVVEILKFRHATLRLMGAAYRCCNTSATTGAPATASQNKSSAAGVMLTNGGSASDGSFSLHQLHGMLQELDDLQQQALQSQATSPDVALDCTSLGCHRWLPGYRTGGYLSCILQHGRLLHHLLLCSPAHGNSGCSTAYDGSHLTECQNSLSYLLQSAGQQLQALHCTANTASISNTAALHALHHTVQTVGVVAILLGFSSATARFSTTKRALAAKKNKKKKEATPQAESAVALNGYMRWLEGELESLQSCLLTKLNTATLNSRNNCAASYSCLTPMFAASTAQSSSVDVDIAGLSLDERIQNGSFEHSTINIRSHGDDQTIRSGTEGYSKKTANVVSDFVKDEPSSEEALEIVQPDFVKTSLMIDVSYQESLANLKTALAAKLKYISSL